MSVSTSKPLPTPELVARLVAAERQCMTDWLQTLADLPGNPFGIAIKTFGQATALVCRAIPAQVYNRVFGLTVEDRDHIPAIVDFYAEHGASPVFDLNPYTIPPYWVEPNVFSTLLHSGQHAVRIDRLVFQLELLSEVCRYGYEIVPALGLNSVTCEIK